MSGDSEHDATTVSVPGAPPRLLDELPKLGRYEVFDVVGAGGMGTVYRGRDPALHRDIAIKLVNSRADDLDDAARLLREARALAQVHHANVVPVYDVGISDGRVYLVMPFLTGGTLRGWVRAAPRSWRDVLGRYLAAGRGLCAAHDAGLVHRDFKPDNVLVGRAGEVYVADFGLAHPSRTSGEAPQLLHVTRPGGTAGTPPYMAPEQLAAAAVDARCDQFAFAVSLWEALFGEHPFGITRSDRELGAAEFVRRIGLGPRTPPARDVPPRLTDALRRALAISPADRWPTLSELLGVLARYVAPRRTRLWIGVAALASLTLGSATIAWAVRDRSVPAQIADAAAPIVADPRDAPLTDDGTTQPERFDPMAFLPEAEREAKQWLAADAGLVSLAFVGVDDSGRLDPVVGRAYYRFRSPSRTTVPCMIEVRVRSKEVTASPWESERDVCSESARKYRTVQFVDEIIALPRCPLRTIREKLNVDPENTVDLTFEFPNAYNVASARPWWFVSSAGQLRVHDDCP